VYNFLLVINSNLGHLAPLLTYSDLLAKKLQILPTHSHLVPSFGVTPFEFMENSMVPTLRVLICSMTSMLVQLQSSSAANQCLSAANLN